MPWTPGARCAWGSTRTPGCSTRGGCPTTPPGWRGSRSAAVEALGDLVAVLKPQVAFFERHGSRGVAVLERVLADRPGGGRADHRSTPSAGTSGRPWPPTPTPSSATARRWPPTPSRVSPYLGFGSLAPAPRAGRGPPVAGVFVLALTSNPEGAAGAARHRRRRTERGRRRARGRPGSRTPTAAGRDGGSVGVVVGATVGDVRAVAGDLAVGGPILAPGLGAQGASPGDLARVFGPALADVLATVEQGGAGSRSRPRRPGPDGGAEGGRSAHAACRHDSSPVRGDLIRPPALPERARSR